MSRLRYVGVVGSIGSGNLTNSATSHTFTAALTYGDALSPTTLPTLTGSDYFLLSILDTSGNLSEVVKVTAYNSGTGVATIARGQEGTTGVAHTSGDKVTQAVYVSDLVGVSHDPRWFPQPNEVTIDEFDDSTIDSLWARLDDATVAPAANVTWTEGGDVIIATRTAAGNNTSTAKNYLLRPIGSAPATGDAWVTCVSFSAASVNYSMAGIVIADGNAYGAGKQVICRSYIGLSAGTGFQNQDIIAQTNMNTEGTEIATAGITPAANGLVGLAPLFLRLVYKGSSQWRVDQSVDGVIWTLGPSLLTVSSFTPAYVGLFDTDNGTSTKHTARFDFLRRVSGVS